MTATPLQNAFGQPVGAPVPGWSPRLCPPDTPMDGRLCRLEPLDVERHVAPLFQAFAEDDGRMWTYLPFEPFADPGALRQMLTLPNGLQRFVIVEAVSGAAVGSASYLRGDLDAGSIEVGAVLFSPRLQRTAAATEAMYLMMRRVFDELGYRRYEWKCDRMNARSRRAALRLGFRYEGTFRQLQVVKGRNRDTDWFSILDSEWPAVRDVLEAWLDPSNFDAAGRQRRPLAAFRQGAPEPEPASEPAP